MFIIQAFHGQTSLSMPPLSWLEVEFDGFSDVFQGLVAGVAFADASGQGGYVGGEASFVAGFENDG